MLKKVFISFLILSGQTLLAQNLYQSQLEFAAKIGNRRDISHLGMVIPLLQNDHSLVHASLIGMLDNKKAREGNFGLGYRLRRTDSIWGIYTFYDIRHSHHRNHFRQWTIGLEHFRDWVEFRFNYYLPRRNQAQLNRTTQLNLSYDPASNRTYTNSNDLMVYESALRGFDIEAGTLVPNYESFAVYLAYYKFGLGNNQVKKIEGVRFRNSWQINSWLGFESELSYDAVRKTNLFVGLRLRTALSRQPHEPLSRLDKKMTSLPVRDIDVVSTQHQEQTALGNHQSYLGPAPIIIPSNVTTTGDTWLAIPGSHLLLEVRAAQQHTPYHIQTVRIFYAERHTCEYAGYVTHGGHNGIPDNVISEKDMATNPDAAKTVALLYAAARHKDDRVRKQQPHKQHRQYPTFDRETARALKQLYAHEFVPRFSALNKQILERGKVDN